MTTTATLNGAALHPEQTNPDRLAIKAGRRIRQLANSANGRIVTVEVQIAPSGALWLYVNGGKLEVIE